jgi:HSP20 family protein
MLAEKPTVAENSAERTRGSTFLTPRVDIFETDTELILLAEMPNVRSEDVDLNFERGELVLHARVRPRERTGGVLLEEFALGDFYRVFQLHEPIDSANIEAKCKNGLLTVHLPKTNAAKPRHVNIRGE